MNRKIFLAATALIVLFGIYGCATTSVFLDPQRPGAAYVAGGELQLLFANPEYADLSDPMMRQQYQQMEVFGKRAGYPFVTGGIGAMEVWHF